MLHPAGAPVPSGVLVRVDYRYAIMHDKLVVVDGATVESGSFNFTASAETRNAENVLVLHDPTAAQEYGQGWDQSVGGVGRVEAAVLMSQAIFIRACRIRAH
jgi:phosphatidylserine/phosphatidylglycerophosphate/cardiolipin synthase-like enzyme